MRLFARAVAVLKASASLHFGQLVLVWILCGSTAYFSFVGLGALSTWRVERYERFVAETNRALSEEEEACKQSVTQRVPLGRLVDRIDKLRSYQSPPSPGAPLTIEEMQRRIYGPSAGDSLARLLDSLGADTGALRIARDSVTVLRLGCLRARLRDDGSPSARPLEVLWLLISVLCFGGAFACAWFWFGARRN